MLTDRELQTLRNMGNEAADAADELDRLRNALRTVADEWPDVVALQEEAARLRAAMQEALDFLSSVNWGTVPYMDGKVYADASTLYSRLRASLAQQEQQP